MTVTNTSRDQSREIEISLDLPKELTKKDIISSDGLPVEYDNGKHLLVAKDKVTLQAAETTFFDIVTRDVWLIPEEDIRRLRAEMDAFRFSDSEYYVQQQISALMEALDRISEQQKLKVDDTSIHIRDYRENQKAFDKIKNDFATIGRLHHKNQNSRKSNTAANSDKGFFIGITFLLLLLGFALYNYRKSIFVQVKHFQLINQIQFAKRFNPTGITCRLLINNDDGVSAELVKPFAVSSTWNGHICLFLKDSYNTQTVLEIKILLGNQKKSISFRGAVLWQRAFSDLLPSHFLTGISINEISRDDLQELKEFIQVQQNGQS